MIRRGRRTANLTREQAERLNRWRCDKGWSVGQLRLSLLQSDPPIRLSRRVLQRALDGGPVWEVYAQRLSDWIAQHCPPRMPQLTGTAAELSGKDRAAGEREE